MSKHTPGPWKVIERRPHSGPGVINPNFARFWIGACETESRGPCEVATVSGNSDEDIPDNARLIAAAPDLLDVAKLILKEWEAPTEGVERGALIARLSQYAADARAAIAKAEGK